VHRLCSQGVLMKYKANLIPMIFIISALEGCASYPIRGDRFDLYSFSIRKLEDIEYKILYGTKESQYGIRYEIKSNINIAQAALNYDGLGRVEAFPCSLNGQGFNESSFVMTDIYFESAPLSLVHSGVHVEEVAARIEDEISRSGYVIYSEYVNVESYIYEDGIIANKYVDLIVRTKMYA